MLRPENRRTPVRIPERRLFDQVDGPPKHLGQLFLHRHEIQQAPFRVPLERDKNIYIAIATKISPQDGSEERELYDPPPATELCDPLFGHVDVCLRHQGYCGTACVSRPSVCSGRIPLRFLTDPRELVTGTRVRAHERWDKDGTLVVTSIEAVRALRSTGSWPLPESDDIFEAEGEDKLAPDSPHRRRVDPRYFRNRSLEIV